MRRRTEGRELARVKAELEEEKLKNADLDSENANLDSKNVDLQSKNNDLEIEVLLKLESDLVRLLQDRRALQNGCQTNTTRS
jgi:hypothetical protein